MKKPVIYSAIGLVAASCITLTACGTGNTTSDAPTATVSAFKLDTIVSLTSYDQVDESVLQDALALCDTYEDIFSMQKENSALWKINNNYTTIMPASLGEVIQAGLALSKESNGAFQITIGSVSSLWDFESDNPSVPDAAAIKNALQYVDDSKVSVAPADENNPEGDWVISKPDETKIDLGALAKGYIADEIKAYLLEHNVNNAIINLGGNILCVGDKHGQSYNIAIQKPFGTSEEHSAILKLSDNSCVSSGIYQRFFKLADGTIYHHILNPETGFPYGNNLYQVSIISDDSFTGDCLSTLCFTLGLDEGMNYIENTPDVEAIFITSDQEKHLSSGASQYIVTD